MPARLSITLDEGARVGREVPVERWLSGARRDTVRIPGLAVRVELDPARVFPDRDRSNDVWTR